MYKTTSDLIHVTLTKLPTKKLRKCPGLKNVEVRELGHGKNFFKRELNVAHLHTAYII